MRCHVGWLAPALLAAAAPALAQEGWIGHLPGIAPALNACLVGDTGGMVTWAEPRSGGQVLVHVQRPDGARFACTAQAERGLPPQPVGVSSLVGVLPRAGEGAHAYTMDRRCAEARPVQAADGSVLGWVASPACR